MAERPPPSEAFTGRIYFLEYTLQVAVPVPLGSSIGSSSEEVHTRIGGLVQEVLKAAPIPIAYKLALAGTVISEESFQLDRAALMRHVTRVLAAQTEKEQP
jgi:hypothetical protein